jgi:hypothetical protein
MISGAGIARGGISAPDTVYAPAAGSVTGVCTVSGTGSSLASATGAADGVASVSGVSAELAEAAGAVTASCAVTGIGAARASGIGAVDGAATVFGSGAAVLERSTAVWRRYIVSSFRQELTPPILAAEQAMVDFDFGPLLISGETVLLPPTLTCSATWGTDAAPSAKLIGSATVNPSPSTGITDGAVAQLVGGMNGATRYKLQCSVVTTKGQTLSRSAYLNCNS